MVMADCARSRPRVSGLVTCGNTPGDTALTIGSAFSFHGGEASPRSFATAFIAALRQVADWREIPIVAPAAKEVNAEERKRLSAVVRRILRKGDCPGVGLPREIADLLRGCQTERPKLLEENH
jgi:hypothetical protein